MGNSPHLMGTYTKFVANVSHLPFRRRQFPSSVCIRSPELCKRKSLNPMRAKALDISSHPAVVLGFGDDEPAKGFLRLRLLQGVLPGASP